MDKFMKIIGILGLAILISMLLSPIVSSAVPNDALPTPPTEGIPSMDPNEGTGSTGSIGDIGINTFNTLAGKSYLMGGTSLISATGRTVKVSGTARASSTVDQISVQLHLQQWNDSQKRWINVADLGKTSKNNAKQVNGSKSAVVPSGYYYRTQAQHSLTHQGKSERSYSSTTYIYVK